MNLWLLRVPWRGGKAAMNANAFPPGVLQPGFTVFIL